ncbi:hypothetical protein [Cumulibacter soli]|uniref:hypothetical protein n=1 Tax=Cumulibacter soli TaxID=2546344 RepID=UPI0010681744|nr:hypothetical protein [Cumulibacter soli]
MSHDDEDRQATLDRLCSDYLDAKMYAEKHKENADAIKAQILELQPENRELRGVALTKPRATWNDAQARAVLSAEQITACTESKLSGSLAKKVLPPAIYGACTLPSGTPGLRAL